MLLSGFFRGEAMKKLYTLFLSALLLIGICSSAKADTVPSDGIPVSGVVRLTGTVSLGVEIPKGYVFVLTDIEVQSSPGGTRVVETLFDIVDSVSPEVVRWRGFSIGSGSSSYRHAFQTGLVFEGNPTVHLRRGDFAFTDASFSGYLKPRP